MGYLTSVDEVEREGWESSAESNITGMLQNATESYSLINTGPGNNAYLMDPVSGVISAPSYNVVSGTTSTLPVYSGVTTRETYTQSSAYSGTGHVIAGNVRGVTLGNEIPTSSSILGYCITTTQMSEVTGDNSVIGSMSSWMFARWDPQTAQYNVWLDGYTTRITFGVGGDLSVVSDRGATFGVYVCYGTTISEDAATIRPSFLTIPPDGNYPEIDWYVTTSSGTTHVTTSMAATINGSDVSIETDDGPVEISGATSIQMIIANVPGGGNYTINTTEATGQYADPSYGWRLPADSDASGKDWINGMSNTRIVLYAAMEAGQSTTLTIGSASVQLTASTVSGSTSITAAFAGGPRGSETSRLGNYSNVQVLIEQDRITVSGIGSWPSMWSEPSTYNILRYPIMPVESIDSINIADSGGVDYRFDQTMTVSGDYPITRDYTLDLSGVYPDSSVAITIGRVDRAGASLTFGGQTFAVEDGSITVDGHRVQLKGATFSSTAADGGGYENQINNRYVVGSGTSEPSTLTFGGTWSITATAYKMEPMTGTTTEWIPGGFGLDADGFLTVGIMAAGAAAIILGMVGARSGSKMAWILIAAGAGAAILFIML